jgi:hypothetical protein
LLKIPDLELDESALLALDPEVQELTEAQKDLLGKLREKGLRKRDRDHLQTFPAERTDSDAGSFSEISPVKSLYSRYSSKFCEKAVKGSDSAKKDLWDSDGNSRKFKLQHGLEKTYSSPKKTGPKPAEL